jgi:hypothetical protein
LPRAFPKGILVVVTPLLLMLYPMIAGRDELQWI